MRVLLAVLTFHIKSWMPCRNSPCSGVEQKVIMAILADHQILWSIICLVLVYVMDDSPFRERFSKRSLGYNNVLADSCMWARPEHHVSSAVSDRKPAWPPTG